jgi:AcrR family transcriptional regulator
MNEPELTDTAEPTAPARRAPGRPRLEPKKREGLSTRDEILEAAAALFAEQGFVETTTRQIAEVVGIKQASLYYHFADKGSILNSLLTGTVEPSVRFAQWLETHPIDPALRLYALARFDLNVILQDHWNLHVLYRLPDVGQDDRKDSRREKQTLQEYYQRFAEAAAAAGTEHPSVTPDIDLVFGLVEGFLLQREWGEESSRIAYAESVARGCLRLVRVPEAVIAGMEESAQALIAEYGAL